MFNKNYLKKNKLNAVQALQFELMKLASFNRFNAKEVIESLLNNRDWWESCFMIRDAFLEPVFHWPPSMKHANSDLIPLRDINDNHWNVDTLYIIVNNGNEKNIKKLAKEWNCDEVYVLPTKIAELRIGSYPFDKKVLSVWWD